MDIAFHYFAVKSLSLAAGFSEADAQIIAKYSQFVDDYNWYTHLWYSNIPNYVKASELDLFIDDWFYPANFNPASTGFIDYIDYATIAFDRSQKFKVSPFHFIPRDSAHVKQGDRRTYPCKLNDESYISNMLTAARNDFQAGGNRNLSLMHIGMLLHTFADTYSHQLFTGFQGWENKVVLVQVINNITGKDETEKYKSFINDWLEKLKKIVPSLIPAIGHMLIAHIPDLTHLSFTMKYPAAPDDPGSTYSRSNTRVFIDGAGKEILNYLCSCLNKENVSGQEWNDISKRLTHSFLIDISQLTAETEIVKKLKNHWNISFPSYKYAYSSEEIKKEFNPKKEIGTDEFYRYNVFADQLLIALYGPHPRNNKSK